MQGEKSTFLPHSEKAAQRICKLCLWIAQGDLKRLTSEFATFPVWGPASWIQKMVAPKPTARISGVPLSYQLIMFWSKSIEHHLVTLREDPSYCCSRYILEYCKTVVGCYIRPRCYLLFCCYYRCIY